MLLFAALFLFSVVVGEEQITNPYLINPLELHGTTQYLVFHGNLRSNYTYARTRCVALGGDLVDVDTLENLQYLTARIHGPAFISGFLGDHFGDECAAIYPGGAVAIPEHECRSRLDSICEVPVLGTGAIHLGAVRDYLGDKDHELAVLPGTKADFHVVPKGFFRLAADGGNFVVAAKQNGVVTTTINIYGSIATNPVLPCCKCCGL
ncbi:hypothetical protein PSACC_02125 [Paramicrosporidium saccamoebae]|uniref:C-type lectin domain-containing protein n=1 Tax=Paramicrosporidium saccamoebae TaxID=1246581 RepID=A0A2H9TJY7_9FUNG|nr:hypothetical protein PSACC_02125 [Paramicrosporidium saccamoebae]